MKKVIDWAAPSAKELKARQAVSEPEATPAEEPVEAPAKKPAAKKAAKKAKE